MERIAKRVNAIVTATECRSALDVGCGRGYYSALLPVETKILLDAYAPYLDEIKYPARKICAPLQHVIPLLRDNAVDAVLAIDIIEHLDKPASIAVVRELQRIARKVLFVFTPNGYMPQDSDTTGYGADEWQKHRCGWNERDLQQLGFQETEVWPGFHSRVEGDYAALWGVWYKPGGHRVAP